jgi:hypothetical protein
MKELKITNHKYLAETLELKSKIEEGFLNLAERLYKIRQERIWESEYGTLEEFLTELDITQSTCSKLCSIYEHWVIDGKISVEVLAGVSWTNLYSSIPRLENESHEDVLEDAKLLTRQDIIEKGREIKHPDCKHEWVEIRFCKNCGKKEKLYKDN